METRNINITTRTTKVLTFAFCEPQTGTFTCTSFPVFSFGTTDGTAFYAVDTPLKQLSPSGSYVSANNPTVAYHASSGTGTITFDYGLTFSAASDEYKASASPRRYRYVLHRSSFSPGTAYSNTLSSNSNAILGGSINVFASVASATSIISVCSAEVG